MTVVKISDGQCISAVWSRQFQFPESFWQAWANYRSRPDAAECGIHCLLGPVWPNTFGYYNSLWPVKLDGLTVLFCIIYLLFLFNKKVKLKKTKTLLVTWTT